MGYVYKHTRLDNNEIFYIGIGSDNGYKRASTFFGRNNYWKKIVNKYGFKFEIIYDNLTWKECCEKEIELIKLYGRKNLKTGNLVNMTDGGEGIIGLIHTEEHRRKNSQANKGRKLSENHIKKIRERTITEETKRKISSSNKGKKRTEETKKKMSEKMKGKVCGEKNNFYGKKHTIATRNLISKLHKGTKLSEETKLKISKSNKGKTRIFSDETKQKMSVAQKNRKTIPPSRKNCCWIFKENVNKSIDKNDLNSYLSNGWIKGRKLKQ